MKSSKHKDSNLRGVEPYQNITTENHNVGAITNPIYATPDGERQDIEANSFYISGPVGKINHYHTLEEPGYATPDTDNGNQISDTVHYEPGYETPDMKRKEENRPPVRSEYDTPEGNDSISDPTYSTPDEEQGVNDDDIKRVEVNGDIYTLPEKGGKSIVSDE